MIIIIINFHNGLGKSRKFSRSLMAKRTAPLNSSREIYQPRKFSSNSKTSGIFYDFSSDKSSVTSWTRFLRKYRKSRNGLG